MGVQRSRVTGYRGPVTSVVSPVAEERYRVAKDRLPVRGHPLPGTDPQSKVISYGGPVLGAP